MEFFMAYVLLGGVIMIIIWLSSTDQNPNNNPNPPQHSAVKRDPWIRPSSEIGYGYRFGSYYDRPPTVSVSWSPMEIRVIVDEAEQSVIED
jgi:hypothetical protein